MLRVHREHPAFVASRTVCILPHQYYPISHDVMMGREGGRDEGRGKSAWKKREQGLGRRGRSVVEGVEE